MRLSVRHSFRFRLLLAIMLTTLAALLCAASAFLLFQRFSMRRELGLSLATQAEMIGDNTAAAIAFDAPASAAEILAALRADPRVLAACVYRADGQVFATYQRADLGASFRPPPAHPPDAWFAAGQYHLFRNIEKQGDLVGTLYLRADQAVMNESLRRGSAIVMLIMAGSCLVAFLVSGRLQRGLSGPVLHLTETAERVAREEDYSLRAQQAGRDEIGRLIEHFNEMLSVIQRRDKELGSHRMRLEEAVEERTRELSRANTDLVAQKERAEAAVRARSQFLASMSHEIRTPMNGIIGMTELAMGTTQLTPDQREYLGMVKSSADSLLGIINDILDFSKIEAGRMRLESIPFNARECAVEAARTLAVAARDKGLELVCHVHPAVPSSVLGDPGRLRQTLVNLLGNAVKFTERGEIVLSLRFGVPADGRARLEFEVRDTGVGIPQDKLHLIFEPFTQADSSTTRKYGGTGLGLGISRQLVGLMGGKIQVESEEGSGSTFSFTLPLELTAGQQASEVPTDISSTRPDVPADARSTGDIDARERSALTGVTLVIADDSPAVTSAIGESVAWLGATPIRVHDVAALRSAVSAQTERPAGRLVVLLDAELNGSDLPGVLREIDRDSNGAATVVLLTPVGSSNPKVQALLASGTAITLSKPAGIDDLEKCLYAIRDGRAQVRPEDHRPLPGDSWSNAATLGRSLRVLLAEDHLVNQKVVIRLLERQGHSVVVAGNGREAVAEAAKRGFDLVLMDLHMPEMGGIEATTLIRAAETGTGARVPILALTADAIVGVREECLEAGMDDFLEKPVRLRTLLECIDRNVAARPDIDAPADDENTAAAAA